MEGLSLSGIDNHRIRRFQPLEDLRNRSGNIPVARDSLSLVVGHGLLVGEYIRRGNLKRQNVRRVSETSRQGGSLASPRFSDQVVCQPAKPARFVFSTLRDRLIRLPGGLSLLLVGVARDGLHGLSRDNTGLALPPEAVRTGSRE